MYLNVCIHSIRVFFDWIRLYSMTVQGLNCTELKTFKGKRTSEELRVSGAWKILSSSRTLAY